MKKMINGIKGAVIGGLVGFIYVFSSFFLQITNSGREFLSGILSLIYIPISSFVNFWCNTFVFSKSVGSQYNCNILNPELIFILILIISGFLIGILTSKRRALAS